MKNIDVIKKFINGETYGKTQNLKIEGKALINYETVIAEHTTDGLKVNVEKYSQSTSTIQNALRKELDNAGLPYSVWTGIKKGQKSFLK